MSYVVLAIGLLLSVCGGALMSFGYGIVEVERGWASFIAGAALLAAGIVTMALALILHSLAGLRGFLKMERARGGFAVLESASETAERPIFFRSASAADVAPSAEPALDAELYAEREADFEPIERAEPIVADQRPAATVAPAPVAQVSIDDIRRLVAEKIRREPESDSLVEESADARGSQSAVETAPAAAGTIVEPAAKPAAPAMRRTAPAAFSLPRAVDLKDLAPHHFATADSSAPARSAASTPAETTFVSRAEPPVIHSPSAEAAAPPPEAEALQALRELPEPPRRRPQEGLTIIGRYESEGTAYTMYADGSIEAHSDRGVFYFMSMAELKAFMDAQARGGQS